MQDVVSRSATSLSSIAGTSLKLTAGSTLFCDFDGPIADVSDRYYHTYCLALKATQADYARRQMALPVRRLTKAQFWYMKQNRVPDTTIADWSGLSGHQIDDFLQRIPALVNQPTLLHQDQLQPGVRAAFANLRDRGIRIVIVTLRQSSQVLDFLHQYDLATMVSQIYGSDDAETAYANRTEHKIAHLQAAIAEQNRLGFDTRQSWMVGDTEADISAGQAFDLPTLALTCGIRSALYLKGFSPTEVCRDLSSAVTYLTQSVISQ
ncbi:HAD family hydrolase [Leptolyngbya iicbica]|uniref:HAD family hydrolase n=2 Tax=Cyanophyceae TaxID=3028117 RepID=A0A4Q7EA86_9CYAN|nr:HAD hydrolase-like protein [Leptolyngbya sp. LK]RZM79433.1 HAD family hydrolase [Leptolyngbya sp. LK]